MAHHTVRDLSGYFAANFTAQAIAGAATAAAQTELVKRVIGEYLKRKSPDQLRDLQNYVRGLGVAMQATGVIGASAYHVGANVIPNDDVRAMVNATIDHLFIKIGEDLAANLTRDNVDAYVSEAIAAANRAHSISPPSAATAATGAHVSTPATPAAATAAAPTHPAVDPLALLKAAHASATVMRRASRLSRQFAAAIDHRRDRRIEMFEPRKRRIAFREACKANVDGVIGYLGTNKVNARDAIDGFFLWADQYYPNAPLAERLAAEAGDAGDQSWSGFGWVGRWGIGTAQAGLILFILVLTSLVVGGFMSADRAMELLNTKGPDIHPELIGQGLVQTAISIACFAAFAWIIQLTARSALAPFAFVRSLLERIFGEIPGFVRTSTTSVTATTVAENH